MAEGWKQRKTRIQFVKIPMDCNGSAPLRTHLEAKASVYCSLSNFESRGLEFTTKYILQYFIKGAQEDPPERKKRAPSPNPINEKGSHSVLQNK